MFAPFRQVLKDQFDLLLFRPIRPDLRRYGVHYFAWGFFITWLAGMGRYWDHPTAELWQYLGLGSLGYIIVMAGVIWVVATPLRPDNWSYGNVLLFVSFTSLPALLYAIPVEKFMRLEQAAFVNVIFLAVVATWRVALLFRFLGSVGKLDYGELIVVGLLPLALIVTVLSMLNLEKAVFDIMGGNRAPTANDAAYVVLLIITIVSWFASPLLFIGYCAAIYQRRKKWRTPME